MRAVGGGCLAAVAAGVGGAVERECAFGEGDAWVLVGGEGGTALLLSLEGCSG